MHSTKQDITDGKATCTPARCSSSLQASLFKTVRTLRDQVVIQNFTGTEKPHQDFNRQLSLCFTESPQTLPLL